MLTLLAGRRCCIQVLNVRSAVSIHYSNSDKSMNEPNGDIVRVFNLI